MYSSSANSFLKFMLVSAHELVSKVLTELKFLQSNSVVVLTPNVPWCKIFVVFSSLPNKTHENTHGLVGYRERLNIFPTRRFRISQLVTMFERKLRFTERTLVNILGLFLTQESDNNSMSRFLGRGLASGASSPPSLIEVALRR